MRPIFLFAIVVQALACLCFGGSDTPVRHAPASGGCTQPPERTRARHRPCSHHGRTPRRSTRIRGMVKRRPLTISSILSLLLLMTVAMLWFRSLVRQDELEFRLHRTWTLESGGGELRLRLELVGNHPRRIEHRTRQPNSLRWVLNNQHYEKRQFRLLGFGYGEFREMMAPSWQSPPPRRMIPQFKVFICAAPYWFLFLAACVPPAWRAWRSDNQPAASRSALCPSCNYDLRATPDRCPECGTVPARRSP